MSIQRFSFLLVLVSLCMPVAAFADLKVGYVDLHRALEEVSDGRDAKKRLEGLLKQKQAELDRDQETLKKEKEVLDKQAAMMSEEIRVQKTTDLQKKLFDLAQRYEKGKAEMATKERTELQTIVQRMDPIIAAIAQREGLTMVFEKTDSGLVYAPAHLDLTNELVRMYNDKNAKKGAGKDTAKASAPKTTPPPAK